MGKSNFDWVGVIGTNHFDSPENKEKLIVVVCGQKWGQFLSLFCTGPIIIRTLKNI